MSTRPRLVAVPLALALLAGLGATAVAQTAPAPQPGADRYAFAGGCWAVQALDTGGWLARDGAGFAATAPEPSAAEPFHLQATDLGSYLLFDSEQQFLAGGGALDPAAVTAAAQPSEQADFVVDVAGSGFSMVSMSGRTLTAEDDGELRLVENGSAGQQAQFAFSEVPGCARSGRRSR